MIFDAFGRLALGQVEQNNAANSPHLTGVTARSVAGTIQGQNTTLVSLAGVSATGSAGGFSGAGMGANGTPIGALLTITLGTVVSAGNGDKDVLKTLTGVAATGAAGTVVGSASAFLGGVQGFGVAGSIGNVRSPPVPGVTSTGQLGTIGTSAAGFAFSGVQAVGSAGNIIGGTPAGLVGVQATGRAGTISVIISGGGGGKKPKTGFEPIKKRPPPLPVEIKIPTYVVPKFAPKAPPPLPPRTATPFEPPEGSLVPNLSDMRRQIQEAQDSADIKAVLAFLDAQD